MRGLDFINKNLAKFLLILIFLLGIIYYSTISLGSHFFYFSNAWDLGIFNQAVYQYANFELAPNTLRNVSTLFSDHIEITMMLFSPLYHFFGSYTLLILQLFSLFFGVWWVYKLSYFFLENRSYSVMISLLFFSFFGFTQAFAFDFHNNVFAIGFLPWLCYMFVKERYIWFWIFALLVLLAKENMGIVLFGLSTTLFFLSRNKTWKIHASFLAVLSIVYVIICIKFIIPSLNAGHYSHWTYKALGANFGESLKNIFSNPFIIWTAFFDTALKQQTFLILLCSGVVASIFFPTLWVFTWLLLAQKFLSSSEGISGFQFHYSVEFAILIALIGIFWVKKFYKKPILTYWFFAIILLINAYFSIFLPVYTQKNIVSHMRNVVDWHYRSEVHTALKSIPENVSVMASNTLIPHISNRAEIFMISEKYNPDYIAIDIKNPNIWPFSSHTEMLEIVQKRENYEIFFDNNTVKIFVKK